MWGREVRRGAGREGEEDPERRQVHSTVEPLKVGQGGREGEGEKAKRERERAKVGREVAHLVSHGKLRKGLEDSGFCSDCAVEPKLLVVRSDGGAS